jgi:hypothetical protein
VANSHVLFERRGSAVGQAARARHQWHCQLTSAAARKAWRGRLLIDTDLSCAMGIPESEVSSPVPRMTICRFPPSTAPDIFRNPVRVVVNRRPMLAKGCALANCSTSFSCSCEQGANRFIWLPDPDLALCLRGFLPPIKRAVDAPRSAELCEAGLLKPRIDSVFWMQDPASIAAPDRITAFKVGRRTRKSAPQWREVAPIHVTCTYLRPRLGGRL